MGSTRSTTLLEVMAEKDQTDIPYLNSLNQSLDNFRRMKRYVRGMSITMFASFLAWTGMVIGIITSIMSLNVVFLPLVSGIAHMCHTRRLSSLCGIFYGVGFPSFFASAGLFIFSLSLWKTIVKKDMIGMKSLIKIGCYIMGGFELLGCAAGLITPLVFIIDHVASPWHWSGTYVGLLTIPIFISAIFTVFVSLMIHGVHKFKTRLVNTYIIYKIVLFALFALLTLVSIIMSELMMGSRAGTSILINIDTFLLYCFFYFYSNGFIVLQYNIMIGNNSEEGSMDLTHNNDFSNHIHFIGETVNHV